MVCRKEAVFQKVRDAFLYRAGWQLLESHSFREKLAGERVGGSREMWGREMYTRKPMEGKTIQMKK